MTAYDYPERDLFAEPERYNYAPCADAGYLRAWRRSREASRVKFSAQGKKREAHAMDKGDRSATAGAEIVLDRYLRDMAENVAGGETAALRRAEALEPLIMKFEVFRRLFAVYGSDFKRHPQSDPAVIGTYVLFAVVLRGVVRELNSLRHVSTLLKLHDSLCSQSVERFTSDESRMMVDGIDFELAFTARLEADICPS